MKLPMKTLQLFRALLASLILAMHMVACVNGDLLPNEAEYTTTARQLQNVPTSKDTLLPPEEITEPPPTPSQTPTYTLEPTDKSSPSPIGTATPSWTPLLTLESTLTKDQAEKKIYQLLHDENACRFPCWWGIEPEKTTGEEARQLFQYLGKELEEIPFDSFRVALSTGFLKEEAADAFTIITAFIVKSGKIEVIEIQSLGRKDGWFYQYWAPYSIEQLLANYGKPSKVWIESPLWGRGMSYSVWIFYDELGALIGYDGISTWPVGLEGEAKYRLCPRLKDNQVINIFINLKSPYNKLALSKFADRYETAAEFLKPLEEVSDLSLDEFYELFTQPGNQPCFDVRPN
jgi:hypothetical protein